MMAAPQTTESLEELLQSKPAEMPIILRGGVLREDGVLQLSLHCQLRPETVPAVLTVEVEKPAEYVFHGASKLPEVSEVLLTDSHPLLLNYGPRASIFGQAPLPDPYRFFLEFHKLVRDKLAIPREPISYLNFPGRMSEWLGIVYSRSYNLLTAPASVVQGASELLDAQLCEHHVLPEPALVSHPLKVLVVGEQWVVGSDFKIKR